MNTHVIQKLLSDTSCFKGVYACNQLPKTPFKSPFAIVINTDPIELPGEHWVALLSEKQHTIEYFDPYGHIPINPEVYTFMLNFRHKEICDFRFQSYSPSSEVCGFFVMFYIKCRCMGMTIQEFKNNFTECEIINDLLVQIYTALSL